ncbi:NAD(P)H-dependent oxidoreductase [Clostridium sporogenes]|uniref:NAD(P)H-dependent oxidoreductase n=1 Tax=Clostridium sporogenes TaxID=1509 RepID=UPI00214A042C|nr:NAD(P)H-dependent oxidoreductase [Clostridium sporogenes]MCR1975433.1 NAD(P)H-dependent oxidoreductase [Clostridium sporogenes]
MITIIFSHPKHDGVNGKIYHSILKHCQEAGFEYTAIDLYKDGFSPLLTEEELDAFYNGVAIDPLVKKYQDILMKTKKLILVFPVWFNEYPAIFKGFYDRVCQGNFAFDYIPGGVRPKLTHIERSLVVTSSHAPTEVLKQVQGNMIENQVINHMLKTIGVEESKWINFGGVQTANPEKLNEFIDSLKPEIQNL